MTDTRTAALCTPRVAGAFCTRHMSCFDFAKALSTILPTRDLDTRVHPSVAPARPGKAPRPALCGRTRGVGARKLGAGDRAVVAGVQSHRLLVFMLGVMGFLLQIPFLLLGPFTGRIVDRMPKLPLLIGIDLALSRVAITSATMAWSGVTNVWSRSGGRRPARLAQRLRDADAAIAAGADCRGSCADAQRARGQRDAVQSGRMIGPAIAGVALLHVSEAWCFMFNAVSNIAIIAALLSMRLPREDMTAQRKRIQPGVLSSLATLWRIPAVNILVPMMVVAGMFGACYVHLMPMIARGLLPGALRYLRVSDGRGRLRCAQRRVLLAIQRGTKVSASHCVGAAGARCRFRAVRGVAQSSRDHALLA